jgi:hypothetical protein
LLDVHHNSELAGKSCRGNAVFGLILRKADITGAWPHSPVKITTHLIVIHGRELVLVRGPKGDLIMSTKAMMGVAIALTTALAVPTFAAAATVRQDARGAYGRDVQPRERVQTQQHSPNPAWDVYDTRGHYIGSDPDPFVRNQLARDPSEGDDY